MVTIVLLLVGLGVNLAVLGLVVFLLRKGQKAALTVGGELQNLENSRKQIELLQGKFKESLEDVITKNSTLVENVTNNILKYYQDTVTTLTLNYNQNSEKMMATLNEELRKKVAELSEINAKELVGAKAIVDTELKKELTVMQSQIDKYTKEKYRQIDEKIYEIVAETAKNTVGKVINIVDHQQLVMTALEQAKKDKFFS